MVTDHPPLRMSTLHFAVATSGLGDSVTTATSLNGRLFWNFCHAEPTLSGERARRIARRADERLRAAITDRSAP